MTIRSFAATSAKERVVSLATNLLIVAILVLIIGALPVWPDAGSWSYSFSGLVGVLLLILLVLFAVIVTKVKAAILNEPRR
jgi:hypothetical protein